jgi:hypothetical protein
MEHEAGTRDAAKDHPRNGCRSRKDMESALASRLTDAGQQPPHYMWGPRLSVTSVRSRTTVADIWYHVVPRKEYFRDGMSRMGPGKKVLRRDNQPDRPANAC